MKITKITTYAVRNKLQQKWFYSQHWRHGRWALLVSVETEDGLIGWGEGGYAPEASAAFIHSELAHIYLGHDASRIRDLWHLGYEYVRDYGRSGVGMVALSALDIALHDLAGLRAGLPVHALLGGAIRDRVMIYSTGGYPSDWDGMVDEVVGECRDRIESGFKAIKIKIGFGLEADTMLIHAVREAIGTHTRLMVDANHAYSVGEAAQVVEAMRDANVYWFEEPLLPEDLAGYRALSLLSGSAVQIATGEAEYGRWGHKALLDTGGVDILQPDVSLAGGISECLVIAELAHAYSKRVVPHSWGLGVCTAASLHLMAVLPRSPHRLSAESPMLEWDSTTNDLKELCNIEGFEIDSDGLVAVPNAPGLGVDIDVEALHRRATVATSAL